MAKDGGLPGWTMITGASEGLGREFAILAAAEGHDLILTARQAGKMEALADELRRRHKIAVEVIPADLADAEAVELLWRRASTRRRIDILVNNAGFGTGTAFKDGEGDAELRSIDVNVRALTMLMKRAVPHMLAAGGGRILNIASVAAFMPGPGLAVYFATKAYVLSLSEAVAEELRGTTVSVTAHCPGQTATNFAAAAGVTDWKFFRRSRIPSAKVVARDGWQAMKGRKRIRIHGLVNRLTVLATRFIPRALLARIAALSLK